MIAARSKTRLELEFWEVWESVRFLDYLLRIDAQPENKTPEASLQRKQQIIDYLRIARSSLYEMIETAEKQIRDELVKLEAAKPSAQEELTVLQDLMRNNKSLKF